MTILLQNNFLKLFLKLNLTQKHQEFNFQDIDIQQHSACIKCYIIILNPHLEQERKRERDTQSKGKIKLNKIERELFIA